MYVYSYCFKKHLFISLSSLFSSLHLPHEGVVCRLPVFPFSCVDLCIWALQNPKKVLLSRRAWKEKTDKKQRAYL